MSANAALLVIANAFSRPELVPFVGETSTLGNGTDGLSAAGTDNLRLAKGFLTAIDFEIAAAHSLCHPWHDEPHGDVYLNRSLERISEHMTALKAIHAKLSPPRDGKPFLT